MYQISCLLYPSLYAPDRTDYVLISERLVGIGGRQLDTYSSENSRSSPTKVDRYFLIQHVPYEISFNISIQRSSLKADVYPY
jgi:hypothetical protein